MTVLGLKHEERIRQSNREFYSRYMAQGAIVLIQQGVQ